MVKKVKIVITLILTIGLLALTSNSYSKYTNSTNSTVTGTLTKWQILLNNTDITNDSVSEIIFEPIIESNPNVAPNTIAPTSKGYFDIIIDPTNINLSFKYTIVLTTENNQIVDLLVSKYSIIPNDYENIESLPINIITDNTITNNMIYNKNVSGFHFEPFTIRLYFEWYEGTEENMNDEDDTTIGNQTINNDLKFKVTATVNVEQLLD